MNNELIQAPPFNTKDLPLAAVFLFYGYPIIGVDRKNPKQVFFIFGHKPHLPLPGDLAIAYKNKELQVEPHDYFEAISDLKVVIYGGKNNRTRK